MHLIRNMNWAVYNCHPAQMGNYQDITKVLPNPRRNSEECPWSDLDENLIG